MKTSLKGEGRMVHTPNHRFTSAASLITASCLTLLTLMVPPQLHGQTGPAYTLKDLGDLTSRFPTSAAQGINNSGQVVGYGTNADMHGEATLFSGTGANNTALGVLAPNTSSVAHAINDAGQIVGTGSINGLSRGLLFSGTGTNNINLGIIQGGPNDPEAGISEAYSINKSGQIVGIATDMVLNGLYYQFGTLFGGSGTGNRDLGTLGGYAGSMAYSINRSGQIVGYAPPVSGPATATLFSPDPSQNMSLSPIASEARGIADSGEIVGYASTGVGPRAGIFQNGAVIDLGIHDTGNHIGGGSIATAVNNTGLIVGNILEAGNPNHLYAFLYTNNVMYDMTDLMDATGWYQISLADIGHTINDFGQVAATGISTSGSVQHALLLNPVDPLTTLTTSGAVSRDTRLIDGMSYGKFTPTTNTANLGTTISFLDGTAGSGGTVSDADGGFGKNRDLSATFAPGDPNSLASDEVTVAGTGPDLYVIQLSYDEAKANGLFGNEQKAALGWLDGNGQWVLAATGDSAGTPHYAGNRAYNPATDLQLGYYGVDTTNNVVWAVVDHAGVFGVFAGNNTTTTPQASLTPSTLSFGSITTGSSSTAQTITLANAGTATLNIAGIAVTGANADQFHLMNGCGSTLAAGANCALSVTFAPTSAAGASATITVSDDAAGAPHTAALSGTGTQNNPQAALSPSSANFGSVTTGSSGAKTFTLSNGGSAALPITSIGVSGANAAAFTITANTCGSSLAAGSNCSITVTFAPTAAGASSATLSVYDSVGTQAAGLTAVGVVASLPQAALTPASGTFGNVTVGSASASQVFTLANAGNAPLPIASVSLVGTNASSFHIVTNTCGASLVAGGTCAVTVTFNPSVAGGASASLSVIDSVGTQTAPLSGTGMATSAADFSITATTLPQSLQPGSSASVSISVLSLTAGNPFLNPVVFSASGLPTGVTATFTSPSVVPGVRQAAIVGMVVTVPAKAARLSDAPQTRFSTIAATLSFSSLFFLYPTRRRRRSFGLLILLFASLTCAIGLTGCGDGIATTASTITVTGTSGSTIHSTTVALQIK